MLWSISADLTVSVVPHDLAVAMADLAWISLHLELQKHLAVQNESPGR